MRLFSNKSGYLLLIACSIALSSRLSAQESFLRLDSVVVLSDTLQMIVSGSYNNQSFIIEDTVSKLVANNQLVKVRNASLQFFRTNGQIEALTYYDISNFGILCNNNIILDASAAVSGNIHGNGQGYPIVLSKFKSRYRCFTADPNLFFNKNLEFSLTCSGSKNVTDIVSYRIELVYFSYEE